MLDIDVNFHLSCKNCDCDEFDSGADLTKSTCICDHHASRHKIKVLGMLRGAAVTSLTLKKAKELAFIVTVSLSMLLNLKVR